jgi:hypothetical protein
VQSIRGKDSSRALGETGQDIFRHNEWRRLHIKNVIIFIYLHSLGLRRHEDKLSNDSILNLK